MITIGIMQDKSIVVSGDTNTDVYVNVSTILTAIKTILSSKITETITAEYTMLSFAELTQTETEIYNSFITTFYTLYDNYPNTIEIIVENDEENSRSRAITATVSGKSVNKKVRPISTLIKFQQKEQINSLTVTGRTDLLNLDMTEPIKDVNLQMITDATKENLLDTDTPNRLSIVRGTGFDKTKLNIIDRKISTQTPTYIQIVEIDDVLYINYIPQTEE